MSPSPAEATTSSRRIGAVVVHFGPWEATRRAVASLAADIPAADIVVIDNDVRSLAPADLPARIIRPGRNLGYGAACNLGARACEGELLLFANNDIEVLPGAITALRAALEKDSTLAAAGPAFQDERGRPSRSFRRAPTPWRVLCENLMLARLLAPLPFFQGHHAVFVRETRARKAETLLGALVLIRRSAFEAVGGFDEAYFFYAEESDLFARLAAAGWRMVFEPRARAIHLDGLASRGVDRAQLDRWLRDGLRRYALRFHGPRGERRTERALLWGARLRFALSFLPGTPDRPGRRSRYEAILRSMRREAAAGPARSDGSRP